ncbi:MAG: DUF2752 domain-containing protein [Clostridiales bacterium]|nr:DUF2752 domain-containing protein [Clostridiales bacterium]
MKQFLSNLKILIFICIAYYLLTWFTGCPLLYLTGISCPGCGMTRAWISVLHLDFAQAFACHPLFPTAPLFALVFLFEDRIDFRKYRWAVVLTAVLFFLVYFIRLIWIPNDIVVFEPENGQIYRTLQNLLGLLGF